MLCTQGLHHNEGSMYYTCYNIWWLVCLVYTALYYYYTVVPLYMYIEYLAFDYLLIW